MSDLQRNPADGAADSIGTRLNELEAHIAQLRDLTIRAYERSTAAAVDLLQARRAPSYPVAYTGEPLVTVRIGAYAGGDTLFERALASVRRQSYENWETVIVCDGRDDATAARIAALDDVRLTCVQRPRNGPYPSDAATRWLVAGTHPFNEAFALAKGAWIAPIDQDDEWTDDHLEVLVAAAQRTRAEVVYGVAEVSVGSHGQTYFGAWPPVPADFGFQAAIHHAGLTAFLYDVNAHLAGEPADWNLARRMLEAGVRFEFLERVVATYFIDDDASSIAWWQQRMSERGAYQSK